MSSTPDPIQLGVVTDVGEVAQALAAVFKLGDTILTIINSPAMQAARQRADVQAILTQWDDDLKQAQKTGDLTQIDKEASG